MRIYTHIRMGHTERRHKRPIHLFQNASRFVMRIYTQFQR